MTQKRLATQAGEGVGAGTCGMRAISVLAALHIAPHSLTSATLCPIAQAVGYVREIVSALLTPSFKGKADRRCYVSTYNKVDTYDRDQCRVEEQIGQRTKA